MNQTNDSFQRENENDGCNTIYNIIMQNNQVLQSFFIHPDIHIWQRVLAVEWFRLLV